MLLTRFRDQVQRTPDAPALLPGFGAQVVPNGPAPDGSGVVPAVWDAPITYRQLAVQVDQARILVRALGVQRGERLAWLGYNRPEMLVLLLACAAEGLIFVPLNFRLVAAEHQAILDDCAASLLVIDEAMAAAAQALRVPKRVFAHVLHDPVQRDPFAEPDRGQGSDDVLIVYTSGTTGRPKGAVHTQQGMLANVQASVAYQHITAADRVLSVLPMFHVGGLCIQTLPALMSGAAVILQPRFDPAGWLHDVAALRPSLSVLVPATMQAVLAHPRWQAASHADLASLRMLMTGSSVVPSTLLQAFHARGVPVGQVYGSTETGPVSIVLGQDDALRKVGSTGWPALNVAVRLVRLGEPGGVITVDDEVGEIQLRAPNLMRCYWGRAVTEGFTDDGWFRTGDLALRDDEGAYWVVGRSKDLIISGGENIYPAEIEAVLLDQADIAEVAVVGVADARWGEVPIACVVMTEGDRDAQAVAVAQQAWRQHLSQRLARYKHPREIVVLTTLPRNAMGKVVKEQLVASLSSAAQPASS